RERRDRGRREDGDGRRSAAGERKRRDGRRSGSDRERGDRRDRRRKRDSDADDLPRPPKLPRLRPGREHRKALLESLPAEQRVVAEQVLRGGVAAVRKEIESQNAERGADSKITADALLGLAEKLQPKLLAAEWRDRADAALAGIDEVALRDLRAVVVAADDYARSAEARVLAEQIRTGLTARLERSQTEWHEELRKVIARGRVVRALQLSSRPPKAGEPLPPDIAKDLTAKANEALGTGTTQHRLAIVLEAVAYSPIRPYVVLSSVPETPDAELVEAVSKVSGRIPEIAVQLGVQPPKRRAGRHRKANAGSAESTADEVVAADPAAAAVVDSAVADGAADEAGGADAVVAADPAADAVAAADAAADEVVAADEAGAADEVAAADSAADDVVAADEAGTAGGADAGDSAQPPFTAG
ncbi:MAG TPA: hypothetical protein DEP69_04205, partial [Acidimicrobiaceae bacterium]|nr:hypothetical protein [Acidimicrobiaceae bacterium]